MTKTVEVDGVEFVVALADGEILSVRVVDKDELAERLDPWEHIDAKQWPLCDRNGVSNRDLLYPRGA